MKSHKKRVVWLFLYIFVIDDVHIDDKPVFILMSETKKKALINQLKR